MSSVLKIIDQINKFLLILMGIFMGIMSVVIIFQVFSRFFLGFPLPWSEELARFLMIYTVFIGAALALRQQKLISIEVIAENISARARRILKTTANAIGIVFFIILFLKGIEVTSQVYGQVSAAMRLPMSYAYAALPLGAVFLTMNAVAVIIEMYTETEEVES